MLDSFASTAAPCHLMNRDVILKRRFYKDADLLRSHRCDHVPWRTQNSLSLSLIDNTVHAIHRRMLAPHARTRTRTRPMRTCAPERARCTDAQSEKKDAYRMELRDLKKMINGAHRSVLGYWAGVRRLIHHSLFLAASRLFYPRSWY